MGESDFMRQFNAKIAARDKLTRIAGGSKERLSKREARYLSDMMSSDTKRIEDLVRSLPDDD